MLLPTVCDSSTNRHYQNKRQKGMLLPTVCDSSTGQLPNRATHLLISRCRFNTQQMHTSSRIRLSWRDPMVSIFFIFFLQLVNTRINNKKRYVTTHCHQNKQQEKVCYYPLSVTAQLVVITRINDKKVCYYLLSVTVQQINYPIGRRTYSYLGVVSTGWVQTVPTQSPYHAGVPLQREEILITKGVE